MSKDTTYIPPNKENDEVPGEFDHLLNEAEVVSSEGAALDSLQTIALYATDLKNEAAEQKRLTAELAIVNARILILSQTLIPEAMQNAGTTSFTLTTGEKITCIEDLAASIKNADKFYDFLEDRGDGALMKIQLEIGKVPKTILADIVKTLNEKYGLVAAAKKTVHPQTLKKYIKELCGIGGAEDVKAELPLCELDKEMVSTFLYHKTSIK